MPTRKWSSMKHNYPYLYSPQQVLFNMNPTRITTVNSQLIRDETKQIISSIFSAWAARDAACLLSSRCIISRSCACAFGEGPLYLPMSAIYIYIVNSKVHESAPSDACAGASHGYIFLFPFPFALPCCIRGHVYRRSIVN